MSKNSAIQWTNHTFNPVWGCTRISKGCINCYAETFAKRTGVGWGPQAERRVFGDKHWAEPLKWDREAAALGVRHRVFCGSMCDVFEDHPVTEVQLGRLMALIERTPNLDWLLLTKRPARAAELLKQWQAGWVESGGLLRPRWWLGTSVEDQESADERIPWLLEAPAAVHFVSYEPGLGAVDFTRLKMLAPGRSGEHAPGVWLDAIRGHLIGPDDLLAAKIDWIIVGGESGPGARPFDVAWARSTIEQCKSAGIACFVKQLGGNPVIGDESSLEGWPEHVRRDVHAKGSLCGSRLALRDRKGGDMEEWPEDLRVREFPHG